MNRRAPDKYRSSWYNRINSRSQGNTNNGNQFFDRRPIHDPSNPILASATSSNNTEAVVKFGF